MSIRVRCGCGNVLEVAAQLEGKYARCPACGAEVLVVEQAPLTVESEAGAAPDLRCARCGEEVPAGFLICPHCGGDPFTGAAPPDRLGMTRREEPEEVGFFRLCLGMLIHPLRTSDELVARLSYPDMLLKTTALLLLSTFVWQLSLLAAKRGEGGLQGVLAGVVVLSLSVVSSAFFVAVVGRIIGGQWLFLATVTGFAFMKGVVRCVAVPVTLAWAAGLTGEALGSLIVMLTWLWAWVLKLLVIRGIFGYGIGAAFLINFLAWFLELAVFIALGFPLL